MSEWFEQKDPTEETVANVVSAIMAGAIMDLDDLCACCIVKLTLSGIIQTALASDIITAEEVMDVACQTVNGLPKETMQ